MTGAALHARWADTLARALLAGGARHAVLSPGSRNTPLVLALESAADRGAAEVHTVVDERTAAFVALGLARISGAPTILCCTSGSAGAHWLPAVVEAERSGLPLLLLTADRPPELQRAGAPQTMDQGALFAPYVRWSADPGAPTPDADPRFLRTLGARAADVAAGPHPGPVHLNLPYREPLWAPGLEAPTPPAHGDGARVIRGAPTLPRAEVDALASGLAATRRGVLVCGPLDGVAGGGDRRAREEALADGVAALARALGWPVLAEPSSGVRERIAPDVTLVSTADALLRAEAFADAVVPGHILRFGALPTSKPVFRWLARHGLDRTTLVDPAGEWRDPDHVASRLLVAEPSALARDLAERVAAQDPRPDEAWLTRWREADAAARSALGEATAGDASWGGAVARRVMEVLPAGALLHVASSLAIRDLDGFSAPTGRGIAITANRGVNGIDGTLATTLGQALAWDGGPVAALVGDLAFLHDLGSLGPAARAARARGIPVTCVVVDNRGGGIFDHLPIAGHPTAFEPRFVAGQDSDVPALCRGAGVSCEEVGDAEHLRRALADRVEAPGLHVLHVPVDRRDDLSRHRSAREAVARALDDLSIPAPKSEHPDVSEALATP
ncbi:MAG: 2-succinyl-5-enolpyruvyl-6-hydroxy-3-cyclohexene-1-carboxylic-acid synthase [Myxococcota bacterium]